MSPVLPTPCWHHGHHPLLQWWGFLQLCREWKAQSRSRRCWAVWGFEWQMCELNETFLGNSRAYIRKTWLEQGGGKRNKFEMMMIMRPHLNVHADEATETFQLLYTCGWKVYLAQPLLSIPTKLSWWWWGLFSIEYLSRQKTWPYWKESITKILPLWNSHCITLGW